MTKIIQTISKRMKNGVRDFKKVLDDAKKRDVNEADTVTIVGDMLKDVFGYDPYEDVTREYAIRGTFCDLAVKIDNSPKILIEVKAIGTTRLEEKHAKQATNYGINENIPWVVLTNGIVWNIYHVIADGKAKPKISNIGSFDLLEQSYDDMENAMYALCKEGIKKSAIEELKEHHAAVNKYHIASLLTSEEVLKVLTREIKRSAKNIKIKIEDVKSVIREEIIKREIVESDDFRNLKPGRKKRLRAKKSTTPSELSNDDEE